MPAGVWRSFVNSVATVGGGDSFLPPAVAIGQIFQRKQPSLFPAEGNHLLGDVSFIKGLTPSVYDGLKGAGQVFLVHRLPKLKGTPIPGEHGPGRGELAQQRVGSDGPGHHVAYREAIVGVVDGGLEDPLPVQEGGRMCV